MRYRVVFDREAEREAVEAALYIADDSPINAGRWYEGLEKAIQGLTQFPKRNAVAPESRYLGQELRHCIYYSHRIIYRIEETARIVRVLHIRNAAQRALGEDS